MADNNIALEHNALIIRLSEQSFNKINQIVMSLIATLTLQHGKAAAANALTNALISATALQMGNHMGLIGTWDNEQERQDYCTKMATTIFNAFLNQRPEAS